MNDEYIPSEGEDHPSDRQLLYQEFDSLVTQICQESSNPWKRRRLLNQLVTKMKNSGLIWKDNVPYYEDALQEQWEFFSSNLWEARTGTQYDRSRGNVITWFNYYFKWRLLNWASRVDRENQRRCDREQILEDGTPIDRIDILPDRDRTHILETSQLFTELQAWIETDPDEVLSKHIRGRPDITCQVILKGLSAGKSFTVLAAELSSSYSTLHGFHRDQCRPHLQTFR